MHEAISQMLSKYECRTTDDYTRALREIMQEIALLGLWRMKFFENASFYGGTALRILYGLDRFSEDLDFSLLETKEDFDISSYIQGLEKELFAFGFTVRAERINKAIESPIQSAFLKTNTQKQLLTIEVGDKMIKTIPRGQILKIKLEVDTDPPSGFLTETRYLLMPIPFAVRLLFCLTCLQVKCTLFCAEDGRRESKGEIGMISYGSFRIILIYTSLILKNGCAKLVTGHQRKLSLQMSFDLYWRNGLRVLMWGWFGKKWSLI